MKRSQIILLSVSLVLTGLIYVVLKANQKVQSKTLKEESKTIHLAVKEVKNSNHLITLVSYGQVAPNTELMLSFEVQGKIERGDIELKPGSNFRTGQILYQLDYREAFHSYTARKSSFENIIIASLPDIELDFPSERDKWMRFLNGISQGSKLPKLPVSKGKEKMFITSRNIISEYHNLMSLEVRMEKYLYVAPFSGTVIETYAEVGSIANPGAQIAKIAKTGDYEVKVPVAIEDLEKYKSESSADFIDPDGVKIATGRILRISDVINQQTQSADVYYSIKALEGNQIYNGMFFNVSINQEVIKNTVILPRTAMVNGKVNILKDNKIEAVNVTHVSSIPDSIFVTGLKDGQLVILEQVGKIEDDVKYEGTAR